jgi:hypothetical protein
MGNTRTTKNHRLFGTSRTHGQSPVPSASATPTASSRSCRQSQTGRSGKGSCQPNECRWVGSLPTPRQVNTLLAGFRPPLAQIPSARQRSVASAMRLLFSRREKPIQRNETMNDTVLGFDCPYCSVGPDFVEMTGYRDGRFVCRNCAHTLRPGTSSYLCTCPECLKWSRDVLVLFS